MYKILMIIQFIPEKKKVDKLTKRHFSTNIFRISLYISDCCDWNTPISYRSPKMCTETKETIMKFILIK